MLLRSLQLSTRLAPLVVLSLAASAFSVGCESSKTQGGDDTSIVDNPDDTGPSDDTDTDGDGYLDGDDCDDDNAAVNPGALEVCDGLDNDCNDEIDDGATDAGTWYTDADADGYGNPDTALVVCSPPDGTVEDGTDCDDTSAAWHPGADESDCTDPNDYNCDGSVGYADGDGDGFVACEDCDDTVGAVNPAATEVCDDADVDENCNGTADDTDATVDPSTQSTWHPDADGDTWGDTDTSITACDPPAGAYADGSDCDDADVAVNPGATEVCNDIDDDCDTLVDDADGSLDTSTTTTWYTDADGDAYGAGGGTNSCTAPSGTVSDNTDCDDGDTAFHPGADESDCTDPADYNCDGSVGYVDDDGDGYAACEECDDTKTGVNPGAVEVCDDADLDEDCNGTADDADTSLDGSTASTWYADGDGDTFGDATDPGSAYCDAPAGFVADATDCDDAEGTVHPAASEVCNGFDDNCDTLVDDDDPALDTSTTSAWYTDTDGDSYGSGGPSNACEAPAGTVPDSTDCDDADLDVHPGAPEVCNDLDDDCDTAIDDDDTDLDGSTTTDWYTDDDSDGYGAGTPTQSCDAPTGAVNDQTDCDDTEGGINPAATEVCDPYDTDENCNGTADDTDTTLDWTTATAWYTDADSDTFGDDADPGELYCDAPSGLVSEASDCDDGDSAVNPDASEVCNGIDDDCNTLADDSDPGLDTSTTWPWYTDGDGDTYGAGTPASTCAAPAGTVADSTDCDDGDDHVHPGAPEVCNDTDDDCDTAIDDDDDDLDASTGSDWYTDGDSDGYGAGVAIAACDAPAGALADSSDCDDADGGINPAANEVCDPSNVDENCNGTADDADPTVDASTQSAAYADSDGDGYGAMIGDLYCDAPAGSTTDHTDCDDTSAAAYPGGTEVCDDLDNDCDGDVDWGNRVPSDFATIQEGIDASTGGDTVCVEAGTYTEQDDLDGRSVSLVGTSGSGFTTIDGGGAGPVVRIDSGETSATTLTGFTITGGVSDIGAGVYIANSSPTLSDLEITANNCDAESCYGTGLYVASGRPHLENVSASGNSASASVYVWGAGAFFTSSSPTVVNSQFNGNNVTSPSNVYGSGLSIYADNGVSPSFTDVTVDENITTLTGGTYGNQYGSLYVYYTGATFSGLSVSANEGYDGYNVWSAGVTEYYSSSTWSQVQVNGNIADTYYADAAGLRSMYSSSRWTNATVAGNQAIATYTILASGVFVDRSSSSAFTNVDISHNNADGLGTATIWTSGLGEYSNGYTIAFSNTNLVGNTVSNAAYAYTGGVYSTGYASFTYSNLYGNDVSAVYGITDPTGSNGNISADPLYTDTTAADARSWDLTLASGSPGIDAGDPALFDADGSVSDMGGYGGLEGGW